MITNHSLVKKTVLVDLCLLVLICLVQQLLDPTFLRNKVRRWFNSQQLLRSCQKIHTALCYHRVHTHVCLETYYNFLNLYNFS